MRMKYILPVLAMVSMLFIGCQLKRTEGEESTKTNEAKTNAETPAVAGNPEAAGGQGAKAPTAQKPAPKLPGKKNTIECSKTLARWVRTRKWL